MIPPLSANSYQAARTGAALIDRSDRGRIVVTGADRASYLQGLFTNDISALEPGQGTYTAYLTPQGRMIADLWVYELGDLMLLSLSGDVKDTLLARLDQFIFTEDVQLGDVSQTFGQLAVIGPEAARIVGGIVDGIGPEQLTGLAEHGTVRAQVGGQPVIITRVTDAGEPGIELYIDRGAAAALTDRLRAAGVVDLDRDAAEAIRIEAGVPVFHRDMDEETIPLEAGIESRAISLTKGCYVGQEVIVRVLHRGHGRVARRLVGLTIEGESVPPSGSPIRSADREIGQVTSSVFSPALERPIALGYVHRDFVTPGTRVSVGDAAATVSALPLSRGL